eukprot:scaffold227_cov165-Amphora_coffeaeformis.AAC.4
MAIIPRAGSRSLQCLFRKPSSCTASRSLSAAAHDESANNNTTSPSTIRSTSLGLEASLVQPHLASISQLPEVAAVLEQPPRQASSAKAVVESLRRAGDIFASFAAGGPEHVAILALLADVQQTQLLDYKGARQTVEQVSKFVETSSSAVRIEVALALAKTLWMQGDFSDCFQNTQALKNNDTLPSKEEFPMHIAAMENAHVLSTLMHEGPAAARTAALSLDVVGLPAPAQAAQCLNLGVVEALCGLANNCEGDRTCSQQFDNAKQTWKQGLDLLFADEDNVVHTTPLRHALEGRLQSNLAYAVLQYAGRNETQISVASEHAREALKALEQIRSDDGAATLPDEGWTRALSLVAQCYYRAGHAVTAEGLLQSALDESHPVAHMTAQSILERQAAYQAYAALCKDWEKRQGDADRFLAKSQKLTEQLKGGWKNATELHSSLWLWTPSKFLN